MTAVRTSNQKCRHLVQSCTEFKGHQLFGEDVGRAYVVYSYGYHFPMFACIDGRWYSHRERASVSTSKQYGQAHPHGDVEYLDDVAALKAKIQQANS